MRSKLPLQGVYTARRHPKLRWLLRAVPLTATQACSSVRATRAGAGVGAGGTAHNDPRGVSTYSRPVRTNKRSRAPTCLCPRRVGSLAMSRRCALRARHCTQILAPLACSLARAWQSHETPPRASTLSPLIGEAPESPAAIAYAGADAAAAAAARVLANVREMSHGRPR